MSFQDLYKKLFSLPKERHLFLVAAAFLSLFLIFDPKIAVFWILLFSISLLSTKLGLKFNLRRSLFLATLTAILSFLSVKISNSLLGSFFLTISVYYFCSEKKIPIFLSILPYLIELNLKELFGILIFVAIFLAFLKLLEERVRNSTVKDCVKSFVLFWLSNDPVFVEKLLEKNGENFRGRTRCLKVGEAKLFSTDFHPGPFRNIGGSKLIDFLDLPNTVYLHSPTCHERDPVSAEEAKKIASALRCDGEKLKPKKPFKLESQNFTVLCFPFDKIKLIFVSGKKRMDDFVFETDNFVVDCHNANFYGELSEEEKKEIAELLKIAEAEESEEASEVKYALVKLRFSSESTVNYVAASLFEFDGKRYAVVVFDSNNIELEFRKKVERAFEEIGYEAIVCSTDNHSKTGLKVKESYRPAGKSDDDALKKLVEACKDAEMQTAEFSYSENSIEAKVIGKFLDEVAKKAEKGGRYIKVYLTILTIAFPLLYILENAFKFFG